MEEKITLKYLNDYAKEKGLPEDTKIKVIGSDVKNIYFKDDTIYLEDINDILNKINFNIYSKLRKAGYNDIDIIDFIKEYGVDKVNKGYDIFIDEGLTNIQVIERIDDLFIYEDDVEAVKQAEKDGIKIIKNKFGIPYDGTIVDTPENREKLNEYLMKEFNKTIEDFN